METTKQLRIVQVTTSLSAASGGVARAVMDSTYALARAGVRVDLLSFDAGPFDFPWGATPPPSVRLRLFPPSAAAIMGNGALLAELKRVFAETPRADVLHLHGMWEPLSAQAARQARAAGIPYLCTIHGMLDPWCVRQRGLKKRLYFAAVERKRLARAAAVHFTAEQEARHAEAWIPIGPQRIILPYILDLTPYQRVCARSAAHAAFPTIRPEEPWVLFLSRIHEKKGLDLLIDSVARLKHRAVQLIIAGTGDEGYVQSLKKRAESAGIAERTHFVGLVYGDDKVMLLRRAEMLVLPTSQENFGLVFPEALACETPVLLTEGVDIYRELVATGGAMVVKRDPADIAEKIEILLTDSAARQARGRAGREWVFSSLNSQVIAAQWMEKYQEISAAATAQFSGESGRWG